MLDVSIHLLLSLKVVLYEHSLIEYIDSRLFFISHHLPFFTHGKVYSTNHPNRFTLIAVIPYISQDRA
jgi:hypothetical protein